VLDSFRSPYSLIHPHLIHSVGKARKFAPLTERLGVTQCAEHSFEVANKGFAIVSGLNVSYRTVL
jgi:hypothetical protein